MTFSGGFTGKLLRIDLSGKEYVVEEINESILRKFVGGASLAARILYDELSPGTDPLGPGNILVFTAGPLTGTRTPCASRLNVGTKSPLTGCLANALTGGYFPAEMKWAGYDGIVIEGKAEKPVYILVRDNKVEIRSAEKYWGMDTFDTQMYLKEDLKDHNVRISCIGPAGENLSLIAAIINEARAAGRKGVGAVMGSKNLKALVIRGTGEVPVSSQAAFRGVLGEVLGMFKDDPGTYNDLSRFGTSSTVEATAEMGVFPARNWQNVADADVVKTLGSVAFSGYHQTRNPCYCCPIGCSQVRMNRHGKYAGISTEGPEYETIYSLGSVMGIFNPEFVIAADRLCDALGLDSISAGVSVAMAMELVEKGIIPEDDLDLGFGKEEESLAFLRMMAYREGIGAIFADGVKKAAETIGQGTDLYAIEVKGLELPAYDVRGLKAMAVNFATSYTGADHNRGYASQEVYGVDVPEPVERLTLEGKGRLTKWNQDFCGAYDIPTLCEFPVQGALLGRSHEMVGKLLTAVTGWEYTGEDVWLLGERMNNLARMFNVREGFSRKDDYLPRRVMEESLQTGLSKGERITREDLDLMLDEYYSARGWTEEGIPTEEKLRELGLEDTIKDLPGRDG